MVDHSVEGEPNRRGLRPLELVLLLSLALNIFILGGIGFSLWRGVGPHQGQPMTHERRFDRFFEALGIPNLDTFQPYQDMRRNLFQNARRMRMEDQNLFDGFWEELRKPMPDPDHMKELLGEIQSHRQAFQITQSKALVDFLVQLQPDQRSAFARIVTDRSNAIGQPLRGFIGY